MFVGDGLTVEAILDEWVHIMLAAYTAVWYSDYDKKFVYVEYHLQFAYQPMERNIIPLLHSPATTK